MQMMVTGMSYKTSPVNVREKLAFSEKDLREKLQYILAFDVINEVVVLSTCNRVEFYVITKDLDKAKEVLVDFIEKEKNLNFTEIEEYFYTYYNKFAAEHLYRVASGIDSIVLGEGEILAQLKNAFQIALESNTTGKIFNTLFKFAVEAGKKVRTETTISQRPTSIGSLVAKLAKESFNDLSNKTAFLIGTGKIGQITAKNLKAQGISNIVISNRTYEKAQELAQELDATVVAYNEFEKHLPQADIVVVSVGINEYLITPDNFYSNKEKVLLVDLSIPRNIEPNLANKTNVKLYDIDSLESVISLNKEERIEIINEAELIIKEEMQKFVTFFNSLEITPVVSSLSGLFEEIRERQVELTSKKYKVTEEQKEVIDLVTKSIIQKILHYPINNLRMEENDDLKKQYAENLMYLFQLDSEDVYQKYFRKKVTKQLPTLETISQLVKEETDVACPFAKI